MKTRAALVNKKFCPAYFFVCQRIDHRNSKQNEQVGHFLDRNGIGSVPEDAKYGKQTEGKANLKFDTFKQKTDQEYQDTDQEKTE